MDYLYGKLCTFINEKHYKLPTASSTVLGGVMADARNINDSTPVHIGSDKKLYVNATDREYVNEKLLEKANIDDLGAVAFSNNYNDLSNLPSIPTDLSELNNDVGYITDAVLDGYATEEYVNEGLSEKADIEDIPSLDGYATENWVNENAVMSADILLTDIVTSVDAIQNINSDDKVITPKGANTIINNIVGDLTDLDTVDKTTIVNAINEVNSNIPPTPSASNINYSNINSGLIATNVQNAIDEIVDMMPDLEIGTTDDFEINDDTLATTATAKLISETLDEELVVDGVAYHNVTDCLKALIDYVNNQVGNANASLSALNDIIGGDDE